MQRALLVTTRILFAAWIYFVTAPLPIMSEGHRP